MKRLTLIIISIAFFLCSCSPRQDGGSALTAPETKDSISLFMDSPDTLNPLYTTQSTNEKIYSLIYDSLLYVKDDMTVEGQLAESVTVSRDAKSIIIALKDGIFWHDGTPFTADDVKYTFDLIKKRNPVSTYQSRLADMSSMVVNDNLHCTLYLKRPNARIIYLLDFPIVPAHKQDIDVSPCGTGRYVFKELVPNKHMLLTKNTLWTVGNIPIEENVSVKILRDTTDLISVLKVGDISAVAADTSDIAAIGYDENIGIEKYPTMKYEYIGFNLMEGSFSDPPVRKAVSAAINRQAVLHDAYFGYGEAVNAPIPPTSFMYNKEADKCEYTENSFRDILAQSGYADSNADGIYDKTTDGGFTQIYGTILVNNENMSRVTSANLIATQLSQSGMNVSVEAVPWDDYINRLYNGEFTMFLAGTDFTQNLDLAPLLASTSVIGGLNFMNYCSTDMDSAIAATYSAITNDDAEKAYLNLQYVFTRDMPVAGLFFLDGALLHSLKLHGVSSPCESKVYHSINNWYFQ